MIKTLLLAFVFVALPALVFIVGGWLMMEVSGRNCVKAPEREFCRTMPEGLGMRRFGYGIDDVNRYWKELRWDGQIAERRFLQLDLIFPLLYCSALALSLIALWMRLDYSFNPTWLVLPVVVACVADWSENALQLRELKVALDNAFDAVDPRSIQVASMATVVKFWSVVVSYLLVWTLSGVMVVTELRRTAS